MFSAESCDGNDRCDSIALGYEDYFLETANYFYGLLVRRRDSFFTLRIEFGLGGIKNTESAI